MKAGIRKFWRLSLVLTVFPIALRAQEAARREVSLGWGAVHYPAFPGGTAYLSGSSIFGIRSPVSPGPRSFFTGPLTASFYSRPGKRWWFGGAVSYMYLRVRGTAYVGGNRFPFPDEHRYGRLCITSEAKVDYLRLPMTQMYARFGLGLDAVSYKYRQGANYSDYGSLQPALHISPVGLSVGRSLKGFLEFGIGYRGIISAGAAYRF